MNFELTRPQSSSYIARPTYPFPSPLAFHLVLLTLLRLDWTAYFFWSIQVQWFLAGVCHVSQALYIDRVCSIGKIPMRTFNRRSLGPWRIRGTGQCFSNLQSSVPLTHHNPNDLRSQMLFRIFHAEGMLQLRTGVLTSNQKRIVWCQQRHDMVYFAYLFFACDINQSANIWIWVLSEVVTMCIYFKIAPQACCSIFCWYIVTAVHGCNFRLSVWTLWTFSLKLST